MQKYGVIGYPLTHSLSPQIHNCAFKKLKIDAVYEKIEIAPENFTESIGQLKSAGYCGLNITIPYKLQIMSFLDEIDSDAKVVGAVNTIVKKGDKWIGYNTDVDGFRSPILDLQNRITDCLILGAGGAARAVIFTLAKYFESQVFTIAGRTMEESVSLYSELGPLFNTVQFNLTTLTDPELTINRFNIIVNATPLGTFPNIDQTPLANLSNLSEQAIVYDLVYNPLETKFLKDAKQAGKNIYLINGMEMLLQQAASAFKLWTGKEMPVDEVRKHILSIQNPASK
jgi:shikimate dehydrogenase